MKQFLLLTALLGALVPAQAGQLITNGGFEAGFTGWTRADTLGSDGTFTIQSGTASPVNGDTVPAPPGGSNAAMSDAAGPGSHVLYQTITLPGLMVTSATLKFDLFIGNRGDLFATPASGTLDFGINAFNQQLRVDLMVEGSDPFSVTAADILQKIYQSKAGDTLITGYNNFTIDVTSLVNSNLGKNIRLRFAEVDNYAPLQVGIDNVSLNAVPEPSSVVMALSAALIGLVRLRRRP
ncbi:MAG: hypothetical protein NTV70_07980 [Acidobacteria bacterium]|nr:hypothetical protein [Acidobacteriota bacterium]